MKKQIRILFVDDEKNVLRSLERAFIDGKYEILTASSGKEALKRLSSETVDLVISDLFMPELEGVGLMHAVKELYPSLPFIIMTAQGSIGSAVEAMKQGAMDYLEKPLDPQILDVAVRRALEFGRLSGENAQFREDFRERFSFHNIVTQSPSMRQALELVARVAASPKTTVSLTGESGTGKELLARAIHFESGGMPGNFVAVNCAAIPAALLESELLGHVRGAFTGADRDREGKFSIAAGGTVLLDEIGDMGLALQAKLLRVLEERCFEKVGSNKSQSADFRVITATHRDLSEMIRQGMFREDLYHRINVVPIAIPPLRERSEDIPHLVNYFLGLFRQHQGKALPGVSRKAMDLLISYSWPGNIRELRNVLERAAIVVSDELIRPEHLSLPSAAPTVNSTGEGMCEYHLCIPPDELSLNKIVDHVLETTLTRCGGNKSRAAELLKVNRKMFYR